MNKLKNAAIAIGLMLLAIVIGLVTFAVLSPFRLTALVLEYGGKGLTLAGGALTVLTWKVCGLTTMKFLTWGQEILKRAPL